MDNLKAYLCNSVEKGVFPGGQYVIGNTNEILEEDCFGTLDGSHPVQKDSLYDLASLTKVVTSIAVMRLLQQGLLCMEDTLSEFLPDIDSFYPTYQGVDKGTITLLQIMTHTSKLHGPIQLFRSCDTEEKLIKAILATPSRDVHAAPVEYSCCGFILLKKVIEVITGMSLDKAFNSLIFEPLGMENVMFNPPASLLDNIAPTEFCRWRNKIVRGEVHDENALVMGGISGNAGLFASAREVAKLARMLLTGKDGKGGDFLSPFIIKEMTKDHTKGLNLARGLGLQIKRGPGTHMGDLFSDGSFGHTGFTGTCMFVDPYRELFTVLLANRVHPSRENEKIFRSRRIFHNLVIVKYGK